MHRVGRPHYGSASLIETFSGLFYYNATHATHASAVLDVVILSVCPSVCHARAL